MDSRGRALDIQSSGKVVYVKDSCDIVTVGSTMPAIGEELGGIVECPSSTIDTAEPYTGTVVVPADGQWAETLLEFDDGNPAVVLEQYRNDHDLRSWVGWSFEYSFPVSALKNTVDENGVGVAIINGYVVVVRKNGGEYSAYMLVDDDGMVYNFAWAVEMLGYELYRLYLLRLAVEQQSTSNINDLYDFLLPTFGSGLSRPTYKNDWYTFPSWAGEF